MPCQPLLFTRTGNRSGRSAYPEKHLYSDLPFLLVGPGVVSPGFPSSGLSVRTAGRKFPAVKNRAILFCQHIKAHIRVLFCCAILNDRIGFKGG